MLYMWLDVSFLPLSDNQCIYVSTYKYSYKQNLAHYSPIQQEILLIGTSY